MKRRTVLVGAIAALGGCASLGLPDGEHSEDERSLVTDNPGQYPHLIQADNALARPVSLTLTVLQGDSTLYRGDHEVDGGSLVTLAGFTRAEFPPERQYVTVRATTEEGGAASVGVSVTECLGDLVVRFTDEGGPSITYAIC